VTTWGTLRTDIRTVLLKDTGATPLYSDALLLMGLKYAQNALCTHTALPATTSYASPTYDMATALTFPLPTNLYLPLNLAGLVYSLVGTTRTFLEYVDLAQDEDRTAVAGYMLPPGTSLELLAPVGTGGVLHVQYYAYYPAPADTNATLTFPQWAEAAVGFKTAAYVLSQQMTGEARISQFDARPDTGNPEHSAMRRTIEWFEKQFQCELALHKRQERMSHRQGWSS
jgi:hypothetical protein